MKPGKFTSWVLIIFFLLNFLLPAHLSAEHNWKSRAKEQLVIGILYQKSYQISQWSMEEWRAKRAGQPVSAIMLDIDHFKKFNDSSGHEAGDFILQTIARTLQRAVRSEDIVCRYGGEEFTVIRNITISAGVSAYPDHADQWTELIQVADTALLQAKNEGRNRVIVAEKQSF